MLCAGFAKVEITPPMGCIISGYYEERRGLEKLDPLYARAVAFSDGENRAVVLYLDALGIRQELLDGMRARMEDDLRLPRHALFVACTHTHTGPEICDGMFEPDESYNARLEKLLEQAAQQALNDLKPAKMLYATGRAGGIAFIRRFRMRDGSTRTNPGYGNPDIVAPIGEADEELRLVRIVREGGGEILLVNFQVHPDTIGDCLRGADAISADYPGFVVRTLEGALPGTHAVYLNGAAGDLNHIDVHKPDWDPNGGYEHTAHMGRVIAGEALRIYGKARPISGEGVRFRQAPLAVPANKGRPEDVPLAEKYVRAHREGRDDLIPETGMGVTTLVAEATRILALKDAPDNFELNMTALAVGGLCLAGIPGEAFTQVGRSIKAASPYQAQLIVGIANGYEGYFPTREAFEEGGYEARSSSFRMGVAEQIAEAEIALIRAMKEA